jgi:hypothetical protein
MANLGGRPTKLTDDLLVNAWAYVGINRNDPETDQEPLWKLHENAVVPTVEGMCLSLSIHKDTAYAWAKENEEFSDVMMQLKQQQGVALINGSLGNKFNPTISKLLLSSKHGYVEKSQQDITTQGESIKTDVSPELAADFADYLKTRTKK